MKNTIAFPTIIPIDLVYKKLQIINIVITGFGECKHFKVTPC